MVPLKKLNYRMIILFLALAGLLWFLLGPVQLGGPTAYVIISGNSMEPKVQLGDLVVARRAGGYEIGQAVVYQHPQIGYVFHRIVEREGDQFTLQGDNNDWMDSYHPTIEELVGKYWFVIPGGGTAIRTLRDPMVFTGFAFIIIVIAASLILFQNKDLIRKKMRGSEKLMQKNQPLSSGDTRQELLLFIGILALAAIVFGVIAFTKPLTKVISDDLIYTQQGGFDYSALDRQNIYDSDEITTGEPVYLRLTCDMQMDFSYRFLIPDNGTMVPEDFSGTYQVEAVLSDVDGWKRSFSLIPETGFEGRELEADMAFDICTAQALIVDKEEKTEAKNRWYDLTILPQVDITGKLNGLNVEEVYQPVIGFQMDTNMLRMPEGVEGLELSQEGRIENRRVIRNTLLIFGREITIVLARRISLITLIFSLLAAVLPAWSLYKDWRASDVSRIQVQYHPLLVDIQAGAPSLQADQVVDVVSFSDLTKMAERYGAMILHEERGTFHRYTVQDENIVYQYVLDGSAGGNLFPDMYSFKKALLKAVKENQFELYYQPVIQIKDRDLLGVEAFLRWNHPELGLLYPADFIDLAEQGDLIPEIDSWVTRKVCQQLQTWQDENLNVVPVSINLSPETVMDEIFIETFSNIVSQTICKPELIQVEINRSNRVFRDKDFTAHLTALADQGISLAIDNFATDDANRINQVFQAPIKAIKIDRSVVQKMKSDPHAKQLVGAVAAMAANFQVEVVAQGVESEDDLELLLEQSIGIAQGFYLGKPIQPKELGELLEGKKKIARSGK